MIKCEKLFGIIDSLNEEYMQFLTDVCSIESPTEYKEGVDRVGGYFIKKAKEKGWKVEIGEQAVSGNTVCIKMNPEAKGKPVCLSGHMDTVHPVGSFGNPPIRTEGNKIIGPGVVDCKGGITASFFAMDALEKAGFTERPVKLILQSDEENSSRNSNKTTVDFMYEKAKGCVAFLNTEPGYREGHVITRKGILKFRFKITGKAAHSASCFEGASAICEAAYKIMKFEKYKETEGITCNCGIISGGSAENTVPETCTFTADFRFADDEQKAKIERIAEEVSAETYIEGTTTSYTVASTRCAMVRTDENVRLFEKVRKIYLENGLDDVKMISSRGGADSADMTARGITCLESFGTIGGNMHRLDEYIYTDSLLIAAKRIASVVYCIED